MEWATGCQEYATRPSDPLWKTPLAENIGENTNNSYVPVGTMSSDAVDSDAFLKTTMQSQTHTENTTRLL